MENGATGQQSFVVEEPILWPHPPEPTANRVIRTLGQQLAQAQVDNAFLVARLAEVSETVALMSQHAIPNGEEYGSIIPSMLIARLQTILGS